VTFRVIVGEDIPDFRTIRDFRKLHLKELGGLFVQGLQLCAGAGLVKVGLVSLDGPKVKANASRHKAMSYEYMQKEEERLWKEMAELLAQAESIPARRESARPLAVPRAAAFMPRAPASPLYKEGHRGVVPRAAYGMQSRRAGSPRGRAQVADARTQCNPSVPGVRATRRLPPDPRTLAPLSPLHLLHPSHPSSFSLLSSVSCLLSSLPSTLEPSVTDKGYTAPSSDSVRSCNRCR